MTRDIRSTPGAAPDHLTRIVESQTWSWLLEVHRRLDVVVELVDEERTPVFPALGTHEAAAVRRLLLAPQSELFADAMQQSMRELTQEVITAAGYCFTCTPIVVAGRAIGALLVGEEETACSPVHEAKLERWGSWLASALERHFVSASPDDPDELRQLVSLYRLLDQAIATGSETSVVRLFVEALAVWGDIEGRGYIGDLADRFRLAVWLPGSNPAEAPEHLVLHHVPLGGTTARLSPGERQHLGFDEATDLIVAPVHGHATAQWLLVASLPPDARWAARLLVYLDVLGQALTSATAIHASRLTWAMTQNLLLGDAPQSAIHSALGHLNTVIEGSACFSLFRSDGLEVLTVGEPTHVLTLPAPAHTPQLIILPIEMPRPYAAMIGACKAAPAAFTLRDETLLDTTAAVLSAWLAPLIKRLSESGDRRLTQLTFDQIVAQYENDPALPDDLSMIVISVGDAVASPRLARDWVGEIRGQLRPTDLVGRLMSGDLGILLLRTPNDGAQTVARRLHQLLVDQPRRRLPSNARVGIATRSRGAARPESLVQQAQTQAATAVQVGK